MKSKFKKLPLLFSVLAAVFLISGSQLTVNAKDNPDYSGSWDISFFDASGNLQGFKTINVGEDGSISGKAILNLDNVIYNTEVSGKINSKGKVVDGSLTDTDKLEMIGGLSGSFTETEGNGSWKNYYHKSGTWKAERSKKDKRD